MSLYEIEVPTLNGTSTLEAFKGQVLLIVISSTICPITKLIRNVSRTRI